MISGWCVLRRHPLSPLGQGILHHLQEFLESPQERSEVQGVDPLVRMHLGNRSLRCNQLSRLRRWKGAFSLDSARHSHTKVVRERGVWSEEAKQRGTLTTCASVERFHHAWLFSCYTASWATERSGRVAIISLDGCTWCCTSRRIELYELYRSVSCSERHPSANDPTCFGYPATSKPVVSVKAC
jgi:hypothetical protein